VLAFASPVSGETFTENFDDETYDLSVQLGGNARWCSDYSDQYGTSGASLCLFNTSSPTVFVFPENVAVQGFEFVAGAKNGTVNLTVTYTDETTSEHPIDGSCCETTVQVVADEGKHIASFSIPVDWDLWLFDSLAWYAEQVQTTTSTTESSTTTQSPTTEPETTTPSTTTTSSTVAETIPAPPPATEPPVETSAPTTSPATSVAPSTTETPVTTPPRPTSPTSSTPPATTLPATSLPATPETTQTPPTAPAQDDSPVLVPDTTPVEQPSLGASEEEKAEFESQVNVFSGEYDTYVPLGSTITVAQRRTVVAATAVFIIAMPAPSTMRRRS
jgi:hypothetical protein